MLYIYTYIQNTSRLELEMLFHLHVIKGNRQLVIYNIHFEFIQRLQQSRIVYLWTWHVEVLAVLLSQMSISVNPGVKEMARSGRNFYISLASLLFGKCYIQYMFSCNYTFPPLCIETIFTLRIEFIDFFTCCKYKTKKKIGVISCYMADIRFEYIRVIRNLGKLFKGQLHNVDLNITPIKI